MYDHLNGCQVGKDRFSVDLFKILDSGRNDVETTIRLALDNKRRLYISNPTNYLHKS